jgi:type II secretory pathway component PulC
MRLKKFLQNINILNIILTSAVIAFAAYSIFPILEIKVKYALPAAKNIDETAGEKTGELEIPSLTQYTAVVDENLFHPERRIPPEKTVEQPLPKPEFVLYGTMISDDISFAYLEDLKAPRNTPGRGKRQVALKKGDSMSGFILKEIETDKILMVRGEERLIVAFNDPQRPKTREVVAMTTAAKPQAAPATPAQKQRESRRAASVSQAPASNTPGAAVPQATPPQPASTQTTTDTPAPQVNKDPARQNLLDFFKRGRN